MRINGIEIEGDVAKILARESRSAATDVEREGLFRILRVDTTVPDGFRVQLLPKDEGEPFYAGVQDALISQQQRSILQEAEWSKSFVQATVKGREIRGELIDAVVTDAVKTDLAL